MLNSQDWDVNQVDGEVQDGKRIMASCFPSFTCTNDFGYDEETEERVPCYWGNRRDVLPDQHSE